MSHTTLVSKCKETLWKQLNQNSDLGHLANEEGQIKSRLVDAFDRRVSTSILVVGPTGSGKRELVEKVMIDYCSEGIKNSKPVSVARINGLVHLNDNQVRERTSESLSLFLVTLSVQLQLSQTFFLKPRLRWVLQINCYYVLVIPIGISISLMRISKITSRLKFVTLLRSSCYSWARLKSFSKPFYISISNVVSTRSQQW